MLKVYFPELTFLPLQVSPSPACIWWSSHTELLLERHVHDGFSCKKCPTIVWTPGWSFSMNSSEFFPFPFYILFLLLLEHFLLHEIAWASWRHQLLNECFSFPYCGNLFIPSIFIETLLLIYIYYFMSFYPHNDTTTFVIILQIEKQRPITWLFNDWDRIIFQVFLMLLSLHYHVFLKESYFFNEENYDLMWILPNLFPHF